MEKVIITSMNYDFLRNGDFEDLSSEVASLTQPDMSMSLEQIIQDYSRGIVRAPMHYSSYESDSDLSLDDDSILNQPDIDLVDIVEEKSRVDSAIKRVEEYRKKKADERRNEAKTPLPDENSSK